MKKTELVAMSEKQLKKLMADITAELKGRDAQKLNDARKAAEEAANKHGFSLKDLVAGKPKAKKLAAAPKYRNPADPAQTWTGRGRQPVWYKDAVAAGTDPKKLEI